MVKSVGSSNNPILDSKYLVGPMDSVSIAIPVEYEVEGTGKSVQGISIESDQEIYIVGINRVTSGSSYMDGFLGIPVASLGFSYYPVTKSGKAEILIVGVYDLTTVNIISPKSFKYGHVTQYSLTETINAFETLQLQTMSNDLTGSHIRSDKVVSVYSGNRYTDVGGERNHLVQHVAPEHLWGCTHAIVPPRGAEYEAIFVTGTDDTHVTSSCGPCFELTSTNPSSSKDMGNEHCLFRSNNPVSVTMIIRFDAGNIDPTMIRIQPLQRVQRLVFFVTNTTQFAYLILVCDVTHISLDNTPVVTAFLPGQGVAFYHSQSLVEPGRHVISCGSGCSVSAYIHGSQGAEALGYPIIPNQVPDCDLTPKGTVATAASTQSVPIASTAIDPATNTGSIDVSTQTDTTQWLGGTTTPDVLNRTCRCRACSLVTTNYSQEELESLVAELRQKLLVKREGTAKYVRTLVSAPDNRTSATVVGYLAGTILVTLAVGLLVIDSPNLFRMLKTIKRNLSSPRATTNK
ncbi:uncharacterized protein LOC110459925 [Mizuhopecten yessoensis]|nr:uncharacterized protein LOC110459925 [Mizuhopecten yessoensis]